MQETEEDKLDETADVIRSTFSRIFYFFFESKFSPKCLPNCSWADCVIDSSPLSYKEVQLEHLNAASAKLDDLKADVQDPLKEYNLGSKACKRPIYVNANLSNECKSKLVDLLFEYGDCFAWNLEEMPR